MKSNLKFLALIAFVGITLNSCSSDDDNNPSTAAPVITDFEYGEGSEHSTDPLVYIGSDLHLEADIYAENVVSSITIDIHAHDLEVAEGEEEWDFEQVFTDSKYQVINAAFHEHIDVPATAPAGEYHIEMTVTDELGNTTVSEGHLEVVKPITISEFEMDESVVRGNDFHVEFLVDAAHGIHNITVDIHAHGLELETGEEEWDYEAEYEDEFHELTAAEFHKHIDVPATAPAGEYHVTFTVEDENGNTESYESHIDVTK